ncbi:hypothetical protein JFU48_17310 [Pseudomonas sp. TH49]|jgi:hypothetical protein|uniref:hypothetical protein n=1 Tax=Pseudomonas TaxID=286 RepID=UPI0012F68907|nr:MULTISPECIES: hypothetical protein [Pseudomonas]MBK5343136.1 hypothetical protein [Pseudomonas sp. TH49]
MSGKFRISVGTIIALLTLSNSALADNCESILSKLYAERHLTLDRQTEGKQTTHFRDGRYMTLSLSCATGLPNVAISWDGPTPDQQFYDLVGRAGSLVSTRSAADIMKYSKQCRARALNDSGEIATVEQRGVAIECQAFVRDGGGTMIYIFSK